MKKGLRNTIASLALSGMSLFGGIKQVNANEISPVDEAKVVEMAKILRENVDLDEFRDMAVDVLEIKDQIPKTLNELWPVGIPETPTIKEGKGLKDDEQLKPLLGGLGEHLVIQGNIRLDKAIKNLEKFLVIDEKDGEKKIDLSKCKKISVALAEERRYLHRFVGLNYDDWRDTPEDSVLLHVGDDRKLHITDEDVGTVFGEKAQKIVKIDPAKGTFQIEWCGKTVSPEISYAPEKVKTATKTLTPAVKKAVAEKRVHN